VLVCMAAAAAASAALWSCSNTPSPAPPAASATPVSAQTPAAAAASPVPDQTAAAAATSRLIRVDQWGVQFQVSGWLSESSGAASPDAGAMLFNSDSAAQEGGLLSVACEGAADFDPDQAIARLDDEASVLGLLPGGIGEGGRVSFRRTAARTMVGSAHVPGVVGEYTVTLAAGKQALFGQYVLGLEVFEFEQDGKVYDLALIAAPAQTFDAHRTDLELTATTFEPATATTTSPSPASTQLTETTDQAIASAVIEGIHAIQVGVQSWAVDHGDLYPTADIVFKDVVGAQYVDPWPTNPVTKLPMAPSGGPGDYTYEQLDGGHAFKLTGFGVHGEAVITVP